MTDRFRSAPLLFWFAVHLVLLGVSRFAYRQFLGGVPDVGVVSVAKLYSLLIFNQNLFIRSSYASVALVCAFAYFCPPLFSRLMGGFRLRAGQGVTLCLLMLMGAWISIWRDRVIHFVVTDYSSSEAFRISVESTAPVGATVGLGFLIGQVVWCVFSAARRRWPLGLRSARPES